MSPPDAGLLLAGFVLAHAAWNVSDLPKGELLVPLAIVERGKKRELIRFEADTQEAAIGKGKAMMAELGTSVDAWAFARDGLLRDPETGGAVDVLIIDFWAKGMESPANLIQRYEPFAKRRKFRLFGKEFRLLGEPMVSIDGVALQPRDSKPLLEVILRGIQQHSKVAPLWSNWQGAAKQ
ncbi:MAG: hypothetical protein ABI163_15485 [Thermoanaerobaculia bacterium]